MLPAFADVLRKELGLPVFDHTSLVDMVHPRHLSSSDRYRYRFIRFPPLTPSPPPHHPSPPLTAPH